MILNWLTHRADYVLPYLVQALALSLQLFDPAILVSDPCLCINQPTLCVYYLLLQFCISLLQPLDIVAPFK